MTPEERLQICDACPLLKTSVEFGKVCDKSKFINPETDEVSRFPKKGFIKGCGCKLLYKVRNANAHCIAGK